MKNLLFFATVFAGCLNVAHGFVVHNALVGIGWTLITLAVIKHEETRLDHVA